MIYFINGYELRRRASLTADYIITAIDVGAKKIGLASFIGETKCSLPHKVLPNNNESIQYIAHFITQKNVIGCVIGLRSPNITYEEPNDIHSSILWADIPSFTKKLIKSIDRFFGEETSPFKSEFDLYTVSPIDNGIPVTFFDEHMTTVIANERLKELGIKMKKRYEIDDKFAAAILLERFASFFIL